MHPTYRRLDEPTRLAGLTLAQWAALVVGGGLLALALHALSIPTRPALSAWTLLVGAPGALAYLGESARVSPARVARDLLTWRLAAIRRTPGPGGLYVTDNPPEPRRGA